MTNPKQIAGEERTLLEMAARAAGAEADEIGVFWLDNEPWNPKESNDDAFRLAVKLRIHVEFVKTMHAADACGVQAWPIGRGHMACVVMFSDDSEAATRLAITEAAARIGASMKEEQA